MGKLKMNVMEMPTSVSAVFVKTLRTLPASKVRNKWYWLKQKYSQLVRDVHHIGMPGALRLAFGSRPNRKVDGRTCSSSSHRRIWLKGYTHPLYYRDGTSDPYVIRQIFIDHAYGSVSQLHNVRTIVDCGANIGCASYYFLHRYPQARVTAIEPDPDNYQLCRKNLFPFRDRAQVINAAVWPIDTPLQLIRSTYRDGLEWSVQVQPCRPGDVSDVQGITIDSLLTADRVRGIDLMKIDVERAEKDLFRTGCESWLSMTRNVAIELHDDDCRAAFAQFITRDAWMISELGELTICKRL